MTLDPAAVVPGGTPLHLHIDPRASAVPDGYMSAAQVEELLNRERERVRQEEKNKLYPELEQVRTEFRSAQETLATLTTEREQQIAEQTRIAQEAEAEAERLRQEGLSANQRLEEYQSSMDQRFAQIEAERSAERALLAKESRLRELDNYASRRVQEVTQAEEIMPELATFIRGNNEDEIEQNIEIAKAKSAEIAAQISARFNSAPPRRVMMPPTGAPPIDVAAFTGNDRQITAQEIADMPMEDYRQMRGALLGAASERVRTLGAYAP